MSSYVYSTENVHVGQIVLNRVTVEGSLVLGVIIFLLSIVGYWGAHTKSRCLLSVFFSVLQFVFAGLVAITAALYTGIPWIEDELETLCKEHPWENCAAEVPKIEDAMRHHLTLVRSISLSICIFLMGIIHAAFLAVSESKRSAYEEIPSYNKPATFVVS